MNFGSMPLFGGRKFVLEDDSRLLGGTPSRVPADTSYIAAGDMQIIAFVPIRVDGTLVVNGTVVNL